MPREVKVQGEPSGSRPVAAGSPLTVTSVLFLADAGLGTVRITATVTLPLQPPLLPQPAPQVLACRFLIAL